VSKWRSARLEDVAQVLGGGTPSRTEDRYFGGGIAWATPTDITALDKLYIDATRETVSEEGLRNSSTKLMPAGAVLLTSRATIGFTAVSTVPICTNQGFINFICGPDLRPEYLAYWLRTQKAKMIQHAGGTTFKEIARGTIRKFEIPVPPLDEQRRIVDLLSRAEGIVRLRREAEKKAAELIPALFLDMFGDPATNPKGWDLIRIGESKSRVQIGPFGSLLHKEDYVSDGVPLINPMHIIKGRIAPGSEQTVLEEKAAELSIYRLEAGDVVMGRRGEMGRCAIVSPTEAGMLCGTGSLFIRPALEEFSPVFLSAILSSTQMKQHLESLSQGVTLANLNRSMIESLQLPLPPMVLQRVFAERVQEAESIQSQQSTATTKAQATFDAMLGQAFS
jgi:type I restriction enzyme S subunit